MEHTRIVPPKGGSGTAPPRAEIQLSPITFDDCRRVISTQCLQSMLGSLTDYSPSMPESLATVAVKCADALLRELYPKQADEFLGSVEVTWQTPILEATRRA